MKTWIIFKTAHYIHLVRLLSILFTAFVLASSAGCTGNPDIKLNPVVQEENDYVKERSWVIIDYSGKQNRIPIPLWVDAYLAKNNRGVEELEEYKDFYVFVASKTGSNFPALKQWQDNLSVEYDFARLAASRIEARFLHSITGYPDDEYGAFYETLIRTASDFSWDGAVRKDDFWVKRLYTDLENSDQIFDPENPPVPSESYDFLVIITLEKSALVSQIQRLFKSIKPASSLTKEQNAAIKRTQDNFFNGF